MSERDFARTVGEQIAAHGHRLLRVSDRTDGRRGIYGLRAVGTKIASTGADYLVLPKAGMVTVMARDTATVRKVLKALNEPFFLELKDPEAYERKDQTEQERWFRWVAGEQEPYVKVTVRT